MDEAGNWSEWFYGSEFVVDARQETSDTITYSGTWTQQTLSSAYGGSLKYAQDSSAKARFTFTGRDIAWVAPQGPDRGRAEVWVDGVKVKTIDLYFSTERSPRMVFTQNWGTSGTHTLEIRVLGTKSVSSTGHRVDLDAFVVFALRHREVPKPSLSYASLVCQALRRTKSGWKV